MNKPMSWLRPKIHHSFEKKKTGERFSDDFGIRLAPAPLADDTLLPKKKPSLSPHVFYQKKQRSLLFGSASRGALVPYQRWVPSRGDV